MTPRANGTIQHVAETALEAAQELDDWCDKQEAVIRVKRQHAAVLRSLHAVAAPHARVFDEPTET